MKVKSDLVALAALIVVAVAPAFAKKKAAPAPQISQALQVKLWRAQAQVNGAQLALMQSREEKALESAAAEYHAAMAQWKAACGADYHPQVVAGVPACVPTAKPATVPEKKK
jgi:hypothetical protein